MDACDCRREREYKPAAVSVAASAPPLPVLMLHVLTTPLLRLVPALELLYIIGGCWEDHYVLLLMVSRSTGVAAGLQLSSELLGVEWRSHLRSSQTNARSVRAI